MEECDGDQKSERESSVAEVILRKEHVPASHVWKERRSHAHEH